MRPPTWLVVLLCVLLAGAGYVVFAQATGNDERSGSREPNQELADGDSGDGVQEPDGTRIHVDNAGARITVSVRTSEKPWSRRLDVHLNGRRTILQRGSSHGDGSCAPRVSRRPNSLITRLTYDRSCVPGDRLVRVKVGVDGTEPMTASARLRQPSNVLMVMVDDMRLDELKYMPNVRKYLGDQGVTFTNGFAPLPLCCPARASVFTGQYPHNHGVWSQRPPWGFASMRDKQTFPVWMKRSGYRTSYLGKYLNRFGRDPAPGRKKGDSYHYVPPGWDQFRASVDGLKPSHPFFGGTHQYFNTTLTDTGKGFISLRNRYQTTAYVQMEHKSLQREAQLARQKRGPRTPWLHYVSFSAPHVGNPIEDDDPKKLLTPARPEQVWGMFDEEITEAPGASWNDPDRSDKPDAMREEIDDDMREQMLTSARQRAESLHVVDRGVGRLVQTLKRTGQLANTTIVFTSDNGYFLGEQGRAEGKTFPYEPSLRVPVLMRGPGLPQGEIRADPFLSTDFAPTFADIADAKVDGEVDGQSMLDVTRLGDETADESWDRTVLTETVPTKAVIRALSHKDPIGLQTKKLLRGKVTGLRTPQYLYTEWLSEPWDWEPGIERELYDIRADPEQYHNLATDPEYADLVEQLHEVLERARTCAGPSCRTPLPENLR